MTLPVPDALDGARLEHVVVALFDLPRGASRRLCEAGRVRVNGKRGRKGDRVRAGDDVELVGGDAWLVPDASAPAPVLLERPDLLVVDKPRGVPCHPLVPGEGGTLVDALVVRFPEIALASPDAREAGLVHRLDTDTSGCLAIARTREAHARLRAAFDDAAEGASRIGKHYLALAQGRVSDPVVVDLLLEGDRRDPRRVTTGAGRPARTRVTPLVTGENASVVAVEMDRGRRHQIRAHLAAAGHPLVGDRLYGATIDAPGLAGHVLHACALELPDIGRVTAPVPAWFSAAAAALGCPLPGESA